MQGPIFLRVERWRVLVPALILLPFCIIGSYRLFTEQSAVDQLVIAGAMPVGWLLVVANYGWYYYVAVDGHGVTQIKYFGIVRTQIPNQSLARVSAGSYRGWLFSSQSIRFEAENVSIQLIADVYVKGSVRRALSLLQNHGVQVDPKLASRYGLREGDTP
jgi:hypothetical protein